MLMRYVSAIGLSFLLVASGCATMDTSPTPDPAPAPGLRVGWAATNITPDKPVLMLGFRHKRISKGVRDPLKATVLALESVGPDGKVAEQAIMVSCDLIMIRRSIQDSVRKIIKDRLGDFDSDKLFLHATCTHQSALTKSGVYQGKFRLTDAERARGVMTGDEYGKFLVKRVAEAIVKAWKGRKVGGYSWALDQAVVGFNRRSVYFGGKAKVHGRVNTPNFDCIEGVEDHGLPLLFFWDAEKKLTGLVINVPAQAQVGQGGNLISADYWDDVRKEIAARHGKDVVVFPQVGASGDIFPGCMYRGRAEAAMAKRKGITWRQEVGKRIADGVDRALPVARKHIDFKPAFKHTIARVNLPIKAPPTAQWALDWYIIESVKPMEFHVIRLGDTAITTNPFELFTEYSIRIQARSKAVLTFVVELACHHSGYLPSARAIRGGGYSADDYLVGPKGGRVLVDESVKRINALWP